MRLIRLAFAVALAMGIARGAAADQVIADDLIVQGSLCTGLLCVNNESFGFDTIRMKGDVIRFQFTDTSASAGFPTTDWQITVNDDDALGTASYFSIEDLDAGSAPFTLEAGAPTDSIHVTSEGHVGLGTATPSAGMTLEVVGDVKADGLVDVAGTIFVPIKAGILPASSFVDGEASVPFAAPFAGDYTVVLTALADKPSRRFKPALLAKGTDGFTVSAGKKNTKHLVEIHWMAQAVGEQ
jgi:hypothetical protein